MTFAPSVTVLVEQPAELAQPDLAFAGILERFPGLEQADAVCLTGSTAAGWGNPYSDIDIYAFTDRELVLPVDETMETWPGDDPSGVRWYTWMGRWGDARVDLKVWPTDALRTALAAHLSDDEPEFCSVSEDMQDFVYRVSVGKALKNEDYLREAKELIHGSSYRRSLARALKTDVENELTDVAGQLAGGDAGSARVTALMAANDMVDHCLVLHGELCRRKKWFVRRLESTPSCGITVEEYRAVVLEGARDGESDAECALRVARWTQAHLVRVEEDVLAQR
jgi:hypothetical protein